MCACVSGSSSECLGSDGGGGGVQGQRGKKVLHMFYFYGYCIFSQTQRPDELAHRHNTHIILHTCIPPPPPPHTHTHTYTNIHTHADDSKTTKFTIIMNICYIFNPVTMQLLGKTITLTVHLNFDDGISPIILYGIYINYNYEYKILICLKSAHKCQSRPY